MKIKDYSKIIDDPSKKYINLNKFAPTWCFRMLIIGGSGSGKTNMLTNLILDYLYYDEIYIYAKDLQEPFYEFLEGILDLSKETESIDDFHMSSELDDKLNLDNYPDSEIIQRLVIFDDFITEKDQFLIEDLFVRGRKKHFSIIYLSQSFMDIPRIIRKNSNYLALYKLEDDGEVKTILRRYSGSTNDNIFDIYKESVDEEYNFMLIDKKTTDKKLKYRKNWDELLF
jgi:hypothetical protein